MKQSVMFAIARLNSGQIRMLVRLAGLPEQSREIPLICAKPLHDIGVLEILTDATSERESVRVGIPYGQTNLMESVGMRPLLQMAKRWFGSKKPSSIHPRHDVFCYECLKAKRSPRYVFRFIYGDQK